MVLESGIGSRTSAGTWLYKKDRLAWTSDPKIRSQLPPLYRLFTWYCRAARCISVMSLPAAKRISAVSLRAGEQVFQMIRWTTRTLALTDTVRLEVGERVVYVDLLDPRFLQVIHEVQGSDTDVQVLENLLSDGDTFIDVGANHGSFAIIASHLVGPDGHVVAVEPQPRLSALVRQSLEEGVSSYEVHQVVLEDDFGKASLYIPTETSGSAGVYEEHSATRDHCKIDVSQQAFDEIVDWEQCPGRLVLKLDVEGSEIPFLEGAKEMIRKRHPVLILEVNPGTLKASGHTGEELKDALLRHGYEAYSRPDAPQTKRPLSELPTAKQRNVLIR